MMVYRETGYMTCIRVNTAEVFQFEEKNIKAEVIDFEIHLLMCGEVPFVVGYTGVKWIGQHLSQN